MDKQEFNAKTRAKYEEYCKSTFDYAEKAGRLKNEVDKDKAQKWINEFNHEMKRLERAEELRQRNIKYRNRALVALFVFVMIPLVIWCCIDNLKARELGVYSDFIIFESEEETETVTEHKTVGIQEIIQASVEAEEATEPETESEEETVMTVKEQLGENEYFYLVQTTMAEGSGDNYEEFFLIASTMLNRARIEGGIEVAIKKSGQFDTYSNGALYKAIPNKLCIQACEYAVNNRNTEVYYFANYRAHDSYGVLMATVGKTYFYKRK